MNDYGTWFLDEKRLKEGKMTDDLYPYEELFTPIQINHLKVKNRICMGPMGNISMCEETGRPNQKMIEYFIQRAKGGTGLLTSGLVHVSQGIDHTVTEQGDLTYFPRIDRSRSVWSGWRDIAHGVHSFGSRFFIQLSAGMGRVGSPECLVNKHKFPISASTNPNFYISSLPNIRVRTKKAKKIVKAFGQAAVDAKTQTIDGVYLHGHEGY